jgi:XRE family transcriptional regulator, fatty acid utilization regulator
MSKCGKAIKRLRVARGLSQEALGAKAGITGQYVGLLENGKQDVPSLRVLRGIGDALQVSVETLLGNVRGL